MKRLWLGLGGVAAAEVASLIHNETLVFALAIGAIVPLAGMIGAVTEDLAIHTGPRIGGLLNATFGNATELVVATLLLIAGEPEVVKASITGSIIGNLLLVLGASLFFGGLRYKEQSFDPKVAGLHTASLVLALTGILIPALFHHANPRVGVLRDEVVSGGVAAILITLYCFSLVFSFITHRQDQGGGDQEEPRWSVTGAVVLLAVSTVAVAFASEMLVHTLGKASASLGLSKTFIGLILVPVIGNAAEHLSAVTMAVKNKVDTALEIAVGSSTQVALFVAPVLVFISLAVGKPMNFYFSGFEIAIVGMSAAIVAFIALDGRSNWLEGAQLLAAYLIIGLSSFFL
jgi:Ca2+:H+ antiporter